MRKHRHSVLDDIFVSIICVFAIAAFVGCPGSSPPPKPPAPAPYDAGGPATCSDVCVHYRAIGCKEGEPTAKGASCTEVCLNFQSSGVVSWDLDCRARAEDCASLDSCEH